MGEDAWQTLGNGLKPGIGRGISLKKSYSFMGYYSPFMVA